MKAKHKDQATDVNFSFLWGDAVTLSTYNDIGWSYRQLGNCRQTRTALP